MPDYELEVIHKIVYRRVVRVADVHEARQKASELWMDRELKYQVDEDAEVSVRAVREGNGRKGRKKRGEGVAGG